MYHYGHMHKNASSMSTFHQVFLKTLHSPRFFWTYQSLFSLYVHTKLLRQHLSQTSGHKNIIFLYMSTDTVHHILHLPKMDISSQFLSLCPQTPKQTARLPHEPKINYNISYYKPIQEVELCAKSLMTERRP